MQNFSKLISGKSFKATKKNIEFRLLLQVSLKVLQEQAIYPTLNYSLSMIKNYRWLLLVATGLL
jgi:hypothetical protein